MAYLQILDLRKKIAKIVDEKKNLRFLAQKTAENIKRRGLNRVGFFDDNIPKVFNEEFRVKLAKALGKDIKLNIIDWNLQKFFENDAYDLFQKTYSIYPARMLRHAWFDLLDNIPVMCEGEPYWRRELRDDFSEK